MSESGSQHHPDDAMMDLLVKQVTEGLSPAEQRELEGFDALRAGGALLEFERAAAAVSLAGATLEEPPAALRTLLERRGEELIATNNVVDLRRTPAATARSSAAAAAALADAPAARGDFGRSGGWGWLAAAACLVLAIFGWLRSPPPAVAPPDTALLNPPSVQPPAPPPAPPPTPAAERAELLARSTTLTVTLAPTKDPAAAGVTGDAAWDPATQRGFLHFVGLASNDPSVKQYQIWVFDGKRDQRYPVDGGVFDVPADSSEVVIPIHAALPIGEAKAFAVTVEKPGGVVVSARGHVVVLGASG